MYCLNSFYVFLELRGISSATEISLENSLEYKKFNVWRLHFMDHTVLSVYAQPAIKLKI